MSWEEMLTRSAPCPCGKGTITQTEFGDDWNRSEYGPVEIHCPECEKKYRVDCAFHYDPRAWKGSTTSYYLLPIDYPEYDGITLDAVYPQPFHIYEVPFTEYLIKNYTYAELQDAYAVMQAKTAFTALTGISAKIGKDCKGHYRTTRLKIIRPLVGDAVNKYHTYEDNYENRARICEQERAARTVYEQEKEKYLIPIYL